MTIAGEPLESLSGLIERVTFFNEENGFAVLKVKVSGRREEVTVVGSAPSVNAGEWLTAEGRWTHDRQFGPQFRAEFLTSTAPTSREGIQKYLGSGLIKGIGPIYAKKLIEKFGEKVLDVIENCSAQLEEVEGIGPKRRRVIKAAWAEQKVIRDIMIFLHSHGVGTSRAVRIYKTYGENAIAEVRANPYMLARDIPGIGFKTADQVAQKIGIARDSILRACAGLEHILFEMANQGHSAMPVNSLKEQALDMLGVDAAVIDAAFQRAIADKHLVRENMQGMDLAFLPALKRAEEIIAARIRSFRDALANYPPIDLQKAIRWYQEQTSKELAPSQRAALSQVLTDRALIVTGGPGVGKTTLVDAVLRILRAKKVCCLLCAPTGRAAKRLSDATGMEAKTIHRLLEVEPGRGGFLRNESNPLVCDLLVVDETSMVDLPLMSSLLRALPPNANLLLVGDVDQLPSVGPGMVLRHLIDSRILPVVRLTEVFRQAANSRIILNAHRINEGRMPDFASGPAVSDFYFIARNDPDRIADTLLDVVTSRIPARFHFDPIAEIQVLTPMNRGPLGVHALNARVQESLNPLKPGEPFVDKFVARFCPRDKVIQLENNYDKGVFNGDIGQVVRVEPFEREVVVSYDLREITYDYGELDQIALAYSMTIHRSQGSEFPAVVIPVATQHYLLLQRNLIYTAVTRARRLVVLIGQEKALRIAIKNERTDQRISGLRARLVSELVS